LDEAALVFRFALGTILLLSGIAKLANRAAFADAVDAYRIASPRVSQIAAEIIPPAETTAGVLLLVGLGVEITAAAVAVLLAAFTAAVVVNLVRGRRISCGCFGTLSQREISWISAARNVFLIAAAGVLAWRAPSILGIDAYFTSTEQPMSDSEGIALLIAGSIAALALSIVEEAASLVGLDRSGRRDAL
jgi:uncharacterized membrane protein YphA (DoxX/SURF4 family)